jgi:hypothetical protein
MSAGVAKIVALAKLSACFKINLNIGSGGKGVKEQSAGGHGKTGGPKRPEFRAKKRALSRTKDPKGRQAR